VTEALGLRVELGGDATFGRNEYYAPRSTPDGVATGGEAQVTSSQESQLVSRNILTYERGLGPGDLDFTGGFTAQTFRREYVSAEAQQFATDVTGPNSLGAGARPLSPGSGTNESTLLSWLGRANYSLMDKYLLTLTGRYDGSSKVGENDKWGFFPSGALAWRVSDEPFLQDVEALSNLKLRASYGITGNQEIGTYQSLSRLQSGSYVLGAQQVSTYTLASQAPNPDLKWERKQQFNAGLDLGLWRGRVSLTANVYSGTTRDLLLRVPLASATGFTSQLRNVGSVSNWGVEVSLNTINIQQGDFNWESSLSLSRNQNEVTGLGGQERIFPSVRGSYMVEGGTTSIVQVGEPLGSFFGFETEGIWQQEEAEAAAEFGAAPGDWKYIDQNGDGVISSDDRVILGSPQADFFGGLSNNFAFGPLTLDVFLQFRSGNNVVWMKSLDLNRSVGISNEFASVANRWQPDNPSNTVPRASLDRRRRLKDVNVEDGSFLRLKDVTLGYRLPAGTVPGVEGARLYVSGQDLWVGTDYSGHDPEVNSYGASPARRGIDLNAYPKARTVTVGASLTF
jgi:TonB-linked SusC/RagA family outer membrane protein